MHWALRLVIDAGGVAAQLVRTRLEDAGPDVRMVESLAPMWEEERLRCGGSGPPPPPPDPPRDPRPLCPAVDATRAQFQVEHPTFPETYTALC